jgi:hypothetical protein
MASYTHKELYGGAINAVIPGGWLDARSVPHYCPAINFPPYVVHSARILSREKQ